VEEKQLFTLTVDAALNVCEVIRVSPEISPPVGINVQVFDAVRNRLPPFDVARVNGVPLIVTSAAGVIVTVPAPRFKRLNVSPTFHATVACAGRVTVTLAAFDKVTVRPLSVNANE